MSVKSEKSVGKEKKTSKVSKEEESNAENRETNPVSILLSKKIRNLRKKVSNFENLQKKLAVGHPLTEDQKKILNENSYYVKLIEDLEKLKQELTPLLSQESGSPQLIKKEVQQAKPVQQAEPVVTERIVERWNDQAIFSLVNLLHFHFDQDPNAFDNLDSQVCDATHEVADSIAHLQSGLTTDSSVLLVKQYLTAGDNEKHNGVTFADMRSLVNSQTSKQWPASQKTSASSSSTNTQEEKKKEVTPPKQEAVAPAAKKSDWYADSQEKEEKNAVQPTESESSNPSVPSTLTNANDATATPSLASSQPVSTSPQKKQEGNQGKKQDNEGFVDGREGSAKRGNRGRGKPFRNPNEPRQPQPDSDGFVEVEGRETSGRRGYRGRGGYGNNNESRPPRNQGGEANQGESPSGERRNGGGRGGNRGGRGGPRREGGNVGGEGGNLATPKDRPARPQGDKPNRGTGARGRGRGEGQPQQQQQPVNPQ